MKQLSRSFITSAIIGAMVYRNEAGAEPAVGGSPAPEAPKLTAAEKRAKQIDVLTKRIETDTVKLAELKLEHETAERLSSVGEGSVVEVRIGRAETSRNVTGTILGVKEDENTGSKRYKFAYGSGFDADTIVIQPSQIVSVQGGESVAQATPDAALAAVPVPGAVSVDDYGRPLDAYGRVLNEDGTVKA